MRGEATSKVTHTALQATRWDVLLANEVGKTFQSINRPALNKVVQKSTTSTQWGSGLHNGATDVVHLYMSACTDIDLSKKLSIGTVFLDV